MSNHLKLERLERHVVAVGSGAGISKLFQVQFRFDGSIFVHFPYHPDVMGIAARCDAPPTSVPRSGWNSGWTSGVEIPVT